MKATRALHSELAEFKCDLGELHLTNSCEDECMVNLCADASPCLYKLDSELRQLSIEMPNLNEEGNVRPNNKFFPELEASSSTKASTHPADNCS